MKEKYNIEYFKRRKTMPSSSSKWTEEFREQTLKHIFEIGKSATRIAEEIGTEGEERNQNERRGIRIQRPCFGIQKYHKRTEK